MKTGILRSIVSAPLLGALLSGLVLAQAGPPDPPVAPRPERDRQQQRKRDGTGLRPAQPPAAEPGSQRLDRIFNALDADNDGTINKEEMARKGPDIMRGLQGQPDRPAPGVTGARGPSQGQWCPWCPWGRTGFAMRGAGMGMRQMMRGPCAMGAPEMQKGTMRGGFGQGRGWARGPGWGQGRGWGRGPAPGQRPGWQPGRDWDRDQTPAFQPPGSRGGFGRADRSDRMNRPGIGGRMAFRMLDADGNGRLEPPEIRSKIETLERLLDRAEREPIGPDDFMDVQPPRAGPGPRWR